VYHRIFPAQHKSLSLALKLRANDNTKDHEGNPRKAGEEWLVRREGLYLPDVKEEVVETLSGFVLTDTMAIHVKALDTFVDVRGVLRKAGTEWLVTNNNETYIPAVHEQITSQVNLVILKANDYALNIKFAFLFEGVSSYINRYL